ncbi:MAG: SIMPL domain-containing protein [Bacteroidales bacterium]
MKSLSLILSVVLLISCKSGNDYKTILLKTSGSVEIAPDEASIIINANCINKDIKQAKSCLIDITSSLNDDLINIGIQKEDILTTNVNLSKDYIWTNNSEVFNGYRASITTSIRVRDLKILDELYSNLLSNDKLGIGSLTYGHSKMDSINNVAYLKALENANKLADQILSQLPEKNKSIMQVSNFEISGSEIKPENNYVKFEAAEVLDKSNLTINFGNMVAMQQLYVEYKIY